MISLPGLPVCNVSPSILILILISIQTIDVVSCFTIDSECLKVEKKLAGKEETGQESEKERKRKNERKRRSILRVEGCGGCTVTWRDV